MEPGYVVTARGPAGEPLEIRCAGHEGCTWSRKANGPKRDDDPIFQALWRSHMEESQAPDLRVVGYLRRSRPPPRSG